MRARTIILPLLVLGVALALHWFYDRGGGQPAGSGGVTRGAAAGPARGEGGGGRTGSGSTFAPPPTREEEHPSPPPGEALLQPGSRILDPARWPGRGPDIPSAAAARRLAGIRWEKPRNPLPGEAEVPDPDRIGPCPPRGPIPGGRPDTAVVRRYIDPATFAPTWIHADGTFTKLRLAEIERAGRRDLVVNILTGAPR